MDNAVLAGDSGNAANKQASMQDSHEVKGEKTMATLKIELQSPTVCVYGLFIVFYCN